MRVLYVYKDYFPVLGGIENHIRLLAEGLPEHGVETQVLVTNASLRSRHEIINGIPVIKAGRLLTLSSAPVSLALYPWLYRLEGGLDIAHLHFPYPPGEIGQLIFGRSRRFVLTYHSDIVRQKVLGLIYRPLLWRLLQRVDLITVSNPVYIQTSPFLQPVAHKCRVIHHGANLSRFMASPEIQAQAAAIRSQYPDKILLLFVGRLRHYKGLDVLLKAMRQLSVHLLIVGTGPMAEIWRNQAAQDNLMERVTFLGEVSDTELVALYHAADIFVLPSTNRAETWGAVQIEAMACGLPLICTELGTGTSYVNQDGVTGLVVPSQNPEALAQAITTLSNNPSLRHEFGQAALTRAKTEFSNEVMLKRMKQFYEDALD